MHHNLDKIIIQMKKKHLQTHNIFLYNFAQNIYFLNAVTSDYVKYKMSICIENDYTVLLCYYYYYYNAITPQSDYPSSIK